MKKERKEEETPVVLFMEPETSPEMRKWATPNGNTLIYSSEWSRTWRIYFGVQAKFFKSWTSVIING